MSNKLLSALPPIRDLCGLILLFTFVSGNIYVAGTGANYFEEDGKYYVVYHGQKNRKIATTTIVSGSSSSS